MEKTIFINYEVGQRFLFFNLCSVYMNLLIRIWPECHAANTKPEINVLSQSILQFVRFFIISCTINAYLYSIFVFAWPSYTRILFNWKMIRFRQNWSISIYILHCQKFLRNIISFEKYCPGKLSTWSYYINRIENKQTM